MNVRFIRNLAVVAMTMTTLCPSAKAEDLKRRGMMGVMLAPLDDDSRQRLKVGDAGGVMVTSTVPGSAAEKAGIKGSDVIVRVGDEKVANPSDIMKAMRKFGGGDTVNLTVVHDGKEAAYDLTLVARPMEQSPDYDVAYDSAGDAGKRVRLITTKPKDAKKLPAILFVQTLTPFSMELGMPGPHPYRNLIGELTKAGFVTMRVERLGMGDSDGADAQETTVDQDVAAFKSALAKLKTYDYVDTGNIFVFSHSTSGIIAPSVAQGGGVKGVITYGTFARPWGDNAVERAERIAKFNLQPEAETKATVDKLKTFLAECYDQKKSPHDVLTAHPDYKEFLATFIQDEKLVDGVNYKYMQQLVSVKAVEVWSKIDVPVLAIWGEADFIASRADSELVASTVNASHPGKATFMALPKADHMYSKAEDQEESFLSGTPGPFNSAVVENIAKWIHERSGSSS
ncbi:MAG: PDZ domain-containing protein [Planctomycetes bacterium]|nr:PDZ domain-containing protein [Planctomycetota bacterium]